MFKSLLVDTEGSSKKAIADRNKSDLLAFKESSKLLPVCGLDPGSSKFIYFVSTLTREQFANLKHSRYLQMRVGQLPEVNPYGSNNGKKQSRRHHKRF